MAKIKKYLVKSVMEQSQSHVISIAEHNFLGLGVVEGWLDENHTLSRVDEIRYIKGSVACQYSLILLL